MNVETPDLLNLPLAADPLSAPPAPRRALLNTMDQKCVASLATLAMVAIGLSSFGPGRDRVRLVDLSKPVVMAREGQMTVGFKLDVNQADWPEWTLLPRIGETLARRIVESRNKEGPFKSPDDLRRVSGIGPKTLANIRPYLLPIEPAENTLSGPADRS